MQDRLRLLAASLTSGYLSPRWAWIIAGAEGNRRTSRCK